MPANGSISLVCTTNTDVYDKGNQDYEAVLRWGDSEGTAVNGGR
jgi:hypothetical protein